MGELQVKKVLLLIIIFIVFITGCKGIDINVTEKPNLTQSPYINPIKDADDIYPATALIIFTEPYYGQRYYAIESWQDFIKEKFGLEIYLSYGTYRRYQGIDPNSIYLLNYNFLQAATNGDNSDVLVMSNPENMNDLTPYYERYGWDANIENRYKELLTVNNGIYAIPSIPDKYSIPRFYNSNYLKELGLEVPDTITDLYEYISGTREMKSSQNFIPICLSENHIIPSLADIFRAFGVYTGTVNNSTISYDPNSNSYEDAVFSEHFASSLSFIRQLQQEKLLGIKGDARNYYNPEDDSNYFLSNLIGIDKEFASEYMYIYDSAENDFVYNPKLKPSYKYSCGYYLTHTNTTSVCEIRCDIAFYMFPKTINDLDGTMDLFNMVMGNPEYKFPLGYGIENKDYNIINDNAIPSEPDIGGLVNIRQLKSKPDEYVSLIPESLEFITGINRDLVYEFDVFNYWPTHYRELSGSVNISILRELFYPFVSVQDAIENYRQKFSVAGGYNRIKLINQNCGTESAYDYGN